ncbi:MAG: YybH family protein [Anaerolineales bacterium]
MSRSLVALLAPAVLLACQRTPSPDAETVRRAIEARNASAERWYLAGHADSLATLFADDVWQMLPNMAPLVGRDSLRAFWTTAVRWGRWEFDLQTQDVVASGSLAVERGRYSLKFTPGAQAPMPALEDRGSYVVLWRRDPDGQWRAVWDAPVSERPPAGAPR